MRTPPLFRCRYYFRAFNEPCWSSRVHLAVFTFHRGCFMSSKKDEPSHAIDIYVNEARREKQDVTIFLLDGGVVRGRVIGFDKHSVVLSANRWRYLIYKHAISTIAKFQGTTGV